MLSDAEDRILKKITKDVGLFLAFSTLKRASPIDQLIPCAKASYVVIIITPPGWRTNEYVRLLSDIKDSEEIYQWAPRHADVLEISSRNIQRKNAPPPADIFDVREDSIVVAEDIRHVPSAVRFAADKVIYLDKPSVSDIHAARTAFQRPPISDEQATTLLDASQAFLLAGVLRHQPDISALKLEQTRKPQPSSGPSLFELPGYTEAKIWARRIAADIDRWRRGSVPWLEIGSALLLSGQPGTGKTYFAEAFAKAVGFSLIRTSVGSWQEAGALDDTLRAMRDSFSEAAASEGAVLFIDEIDSIGSREELRSSRSPTYWRVVVNQFLALTSSAENGVFLIAATNYPDAIDPAALRSGRFEDRIELELPTSTECAEMLAYHLRSGIAPSQLLPLVSDLESQSPADMHKYARRAKRLAREQGRDVEIADVIVVLPPRIPRPLDDQFRFAVHECGHALLSLITGYAATATISIRETYDPDAKIQTGGVTSYHRNLNLILTDRLLLDRIAISLAGLAAEEAVFGDRSVGAGGVEGSDVARATSIARQLVGSLGLGEVPKYVFDARANGAILPEDMEEEVSTILREQYKRSLEFLTSERDQLVSIAKDVVVHRSIDLGRESIVLKTHG